MIGDGLNRAITDSSEAETAGGSSEGTTSGKWQAALAALLGGAGRSARTAATGN